MGGTGGSLDSWWPSVPACNFPTAKAMTRNKPPHPQPQSYHLKHGGEARRCLLSTGCGGCSLVAISRNWSRLAGWRKDQRGIRVAHRIEDRGSTDRAEAEGEQFPLRSWGGLLCGGSGD